MDTDHFARIVSPRGSVVTIPYLSEEQAADVAAQYGPVAEPVAPSAASEDEGVCGSCNGAGGWFEEVKVKTPSGGEVVTQKWVNCRACGRKP